MNMDTLWQIVLNISVPVLFLIFLVLCVFVLGSTFMLLTKAALWLEEKLGV